MLKYNDALKDLYITEDVAIIVNKIGLLINENLNYWYGDNFDKFEIQINDFQSKSMYAEHIKTRLQEIYSDDDRFSEIKITVNSSELNSGRLKIHILFKINDYNDLIKQILKNNLRLKPYIDKINNILKDMLKHVPSSAILKEGIDVSLSDMDEVNNVILYELKDKYVKYAGWDERQIVIREGIKGLCFYVNK